MKWLEISAVAFTVIYVILAIKGNPWCWIAGIIGAALTIIFDLQLRYYQDAVLQTYYVGAGIYGWKQWTKRKDTSDSFTVFSVDLNFFAPWLFIGFILTPLFGFIFSQLGNSFPYVDAFTTVFSFIATYLTAKKILESWLMWMVIDTVFIVQYFLKDAYWFTALFIFLTIMAYIGYSGWKKKIVS